MNSFSDRQKEVIDVSIKIIAEKGIQQLTIKNISKSLGISEPAIYRHFESKIDILLAILSNFKEMTKDSIERLQLINLSAIQKIESLFMNHFKNFTKNPELASVIFSEEIFQNDIRLSTQVLEIMKYNQEAMLGLIEKAQRNNDIKTNIPREQLSLIIIGGLRIIITKWRLSNYSFDLEKEGTDLWKAIHKLIAP